MLRSEIGLLSLTLVPGLSVLGIKIIVAFLYMSGKYPAERLLLNMSLRYRVILSGRDFNCLAVSPFGPGALCFSFVMNSVSSLSSIGGQLSGSSRVRSLLLYGVVRLGWRVWDIVSVKSSSKLLSSGSVSENSACQ